MEDTNSKSSKHTPGPLKKLQDAYVTRTIAGSPYVIGERVTVLSVVNNGTKRNPSFRYYVAGAWMDADALSADPVAL